MLKEANPENISVSEVNEREDWSKEDEDEEKWREFVNNIEENGINQPPVVRVDQDGGYEVVIGQRRVEAAKDAKLDTIEVVVKDWDDGEALQQSISENINEFKKSVSAYDRALALQQLGELEYDGDNPPQTWYTERLGVSKATISRWMEPLSDEWEDTIVDPTSKQSGEFHVKLIRELGSRKLTSIRKTTGGGEDGVWLAEKAADENLSIQDLSTIRDHVDRGASVENATKVVLGELSMAEVQGSVEDDHETTVDETFEEMDTYDEDEEEESKPTAPGTTTTERSTTEDDEDVATTDEEEADTSWLDELREEKGQEEEEEDEGPTIAGLGRNVEFEEDSLEDVEPATPTPTLPRDMTVAAREARDELAFRDIEDLMLSALRKYLREGGYLTNESDAGIDEPLEIEEEPAE